MKLKNQTTYTNVDHDAIVGELEKELASHAALEAKQNAGLNMPVTETDLRAYIMNSVETKVQALITKTQERFLPVSGIAVAQAIQTEADTKVQKLDAGINDAEHKVRLLEEEKKGRIPDLSKRKIRRLVYLFAVLVGITDGIMAYDSLRFASMSRVAAFISSVGIAAAIVAAIHIMGGYIARATTKRAKLTRFALVLAVAFIGFYFLNDLRASGYNEAARLSTNPDAQTEITSHISPLTLTFISFILFAVVLAFAVKYAKTDEQRKAEQDYDLLQNQIIALTNNIQKHKADITVIRAEASQKTAEALGLFEYAQSVEQRLLSIAKQTMNIYAENNLRHRTDKLVPEFFAHPLPFKFILFFTPAKTS